MARKKKKIILLLAGGTLLLDKEAKFLAVQDSLDVDHWLRQMPELSILADIEPIFISGEDQEITPQIWEKIANKISNNLGNADGFIVVSKTGQLINTALVLGFIFQNIKKSIILTCSQISGTDFLNKKEKINKLKDKHGGLGLRSNLINALQITDSKLPGPAIMSGTRLISAVQAVKNYHDDTNIFASFNDAYWGKVGFGINIKKDLKHSTKQFEIFKKINSKILILEDFPGVEWSVDREIFKKYQGVIIKTSAQSIDQNKQKQIASWKLPVVLYNYQGILSIEGDVVISGCTWSAAVVKTMWALANFKELADFNKVMKQNLIGEFTV